MIKRYLEEEGSRHAMEFNRKIKMDGLKLLSMLDDCYTKCVFFDPQYRGVLDKLSYGNEGKNRGAARSALTQMTEDTIRQFINEIGRVLRPSGYLFLWIDKFHLCEGVADWFDNEVLEIVDLIVWDKQKIGMGYRTRRKSEYLIVLQKKPKLAKATWSTHCIPDVWGERADKVHAHSKPVGLQAELISAVTNEGDIVLDPAAGGYSVLEACKNTRRNFLGCDIAFGEEVIV